MNNVFDLKKRIMTRVYLEYTKNMVLGHFDYFMLGIFIIVSVMFISIQDVLNNIPRDSFSSVFSFFMVALRNTSVIIQILIAGFFVRAIIASAKLAYKNKNIGWILAKIKFQERLSQ